MEELQTVHSITNPVSDETGLKLNLHLHSWDKYSIKDEQCTCTITKENAEIKVQGDYSCLCFNTTKEEVDLDLKGTYYDDNGVCKEYINPDARMRKFLSKSATFPSSEVEASQFLNDELNGESYVGSNGASCTTASVQNSYEDKVPSFKRSTSLPASSKLVSAMKGGRAQNGGASPRLDMDMHVKWAEDVYDPPATSISHTVKSYTIRRPKSKKKDYHWHKHNKGKNSRPNVNGKKLPDRRNISNLSAPFPTKLHAGVSPSAPSDLHGKSAMEIFGVHDVKCGSALLRESLAKVHLNLGQPT